MFAPKNCYSKGANFYSPCVAISALATTFCVSSAIIGSFLLKKTTGTPRELGYFLHKKSALTSVVLNFYDNLPPFERNSLNLKNGLGAVWRK